MNLLYVDEAGSHHDSKQQFFVLAGFSVFERQGYWLSEELSKIAGRFNPENPSSVELHGSPMYSGRNFWRRFPVSERTKAMKDCLIALATSHLSHKVFACVIKKSLIFPKNSVEVAFEQLSSRFDFFLKRSHNRGNTQRGLIIFDKCTYETTIQKLAADFRNIGHSWGVIKNLAEVPLFLDSKASRMIQLADLVAYSIHRNYEHKDSQFFELFAARFDRVGKNVHGLCEILKPYKQ